MMPRTIRSFSLILSIVFSLAPFAARAQQPQPLKPEVKPEAPPQAAQPASRIEAPAMRPPNASGDLSYRIGPGDILDIRVFGRPEMTKDVRVDNFGRIRMPFLDELQAACLTEAQLAQALAEKYKKYLRDPQVDVMVKEFRSQPVAVIGAVSSPGRFQLQRRIRLLELLTFAGGPTIHAGSTVHLIHSSDHTYCPSPQEESAIEAKPAASPAESVDSIAPLLSSVKLKEVLNGASSANPYVQPGDIISIPEADQFFVTGAVVKPGAYPMLTRMTLTQAVALAGGVNGEGARNRVRLVRQEPGKETRTEKVYSLDDIHRRKIADVELLANDIVEVPGSTMRVAAKSMLGVSINMLTALPYFIIP
jgi:polysaccharide export outer membrane protein